MLAGASRVFISLSGPTQPHTGGSRTLILAQHQAVRDSVLEPSPHGPGPIPKGAAPLVQL